MISNEATKEELAEEIIKLKSQNKHLSAENNYYKNIIKEIREYIEKASYFQGNKVLNEKDILEILDKENK